MANKRKSKKNSFGKFLVLLIEMLFLGVVLLYVFDYPFPTEPTQPQVVPNVTQVPDANVTPEVPALPIQTPEGDLVPIVTPEPSTDTEPMEFTLHQINVGCANAYLMKFGTTTIFIDGGLNSSLKTVTSYLDAQGVTYLDAYVGTHWHGDHTDNAAELLARYGDSETILYGPSETENGLVKMLRERVYSKKSSAAKLASDVNYIQFKEGDTLKFGPVELICVGPYKIQQSGSCNYDSMNFVIRYGDFKAFMTADYVHSKQVMEMYGDLIADVDILQMPHHGLDPIYISKTALKHANPKVILVPANSSGPTKKMVKECGLECPVYDNKSGNIVISTYGNDFEITTSK